jgi:hypothetical protein
VRPASCSPMSSKSGLRRPECGPPTRAGFGGLLP